MTPSKGDSGERARTKEHQWILRVTQRGSTPSPEDLDGTPTGREDIDDENCYPSGASRRIQEGACATMLGRQMRKPAAGDLVGLDAHEAVLRAGVPREQRQVERVEALLHAARSRRRGP